MEQRNATGSAILLLKTRDQTTWSVPHFRGDRIMSGIVIGSAAAVISTAVAVVAATLPDAQSLLSPLTEGGNEYAIAAASVLASLPMLAIMSVLAISGRE
jgi:lipid-binding SYLF domain-containing protein